MISSSSFLIAGHKDDVMVIWRLGSSLSPEFLGVMEGLNADVTHLALADSGPTQSMLISSSTQLPFVKLWNLNLISSHLATNRTFFYKSGPMGLTPDCAHVVYSAPSMEEENNNSRLNLRIWNSATGVVGELESGNDEETCFHVIDESRFLVGNRSGNVLMINFKTRQVEGTMKSDREGPILLVTLNQTKTLLGCLQDLSEHLAASIWDVKLKTCRRVVQFDKAEICCLTVTVRGELLMGEP